MHIANAVNRIRSGQKIKNPEFNRIRRDHPDEFGTAVKCLKIIDDFFGIEMPLEEAGFLALFFTMDDMTEGKKIERPVSIVVMAHGDCTASSMAKVCNTLLKTEIAVGIDVPLNEAPQSGWLRLKDWLSTLKEKTDILLMVDMGSLTNLEKKIEEEMDIHCRTISMVSTLHVLEAGRKALLGIPLEQVFKETQGISNFLSHINQEQQNSKMRHNKCIVTVCASGEGTAVMTKDILLKQLGLSDSDISVITMGATGNSLLEDKIKFLSEKQDILFIISPFPIETDIPLFSLEDLTYPNTIEKMKDLIETDRILRKLSEAYRDSFHKCDSRTAFYVSDRIIGNIEKRLLKKLLDSVRIGLLCHSACLIERLLNRDILKPFPDKNPFKEKYGSTIDIVKEELGIIKDWFSVIPSEDEICYIASCFLSEHSCSD